MIGSVTQLSLDAFRLGIAMGRAELASTQTEYEPLQQMMTAALQEMGIDEAEAPGAFTEYEAAEQSMVDRIVPHLASRRAMLCGDTAALPVFFLSFFSIQLAVAIAFRAPRAEPGELVELALTDLGLSPDDQLRALERNAGYIAVQGVDGEETVGKNSATVAALSFVETVLVRLLEDADDADLSAEVLSMRGDIRDFQDEFTRQTAQLELVVSSGNAAVTSAIGAVTELLIANGMDPAAAAAVTSDDPSSFCDKLLRWFGGSGPRGAGEAAFWAALDFVPGGTGVKLGFKVAEAIRGSVKATQL